MGIEAEIDDLDLITACQSNSKRHVETFYKRFYGYVIGICLRYLLERNAAEEICNDSFIKVFDNLKAFDTSMPVKPWIRRITVNCCISYLRKHKRLTEPLSDTSHEIQCNEVISSSLDYAFLLQTVQKLPVKLRIVFNMFEIEGYSHKEIATQMDIPESSSRAYLSRAKKQLIKYLEQENKVKHA